MAAAAHTLSSGTTRDVSSGTTRDISEAEHTSRLFVRMHRHGDQAAREELIESFTPLSRKLARRYRNTSEPWEDLCQVAQVGLIKAVDGFDPFRGFPFASYAIPTILGELRRYFRGASWAVRVPRATQERALEIRDAERALGDELGRKPNVSEIAQFMEISFEEALDALQALRALGSVSLDAPRGDESGEGATSYAERVGNDDPHYELVEQDVDLAAALPSLKSRQREILRLRFFEELSQRQIAEQIGVSQMQVSRLLAGCVEDLRKLTGAAA
jgi:RNA polymerase sigma-B factor